MLDILRINGLFINLKKYYFYKKEIYSLGYIVLVYEIWIKDKKIEMIKNWPKLKSIKGIYKFSRFANFSCRFIQSFYKTVTQLILILKMLRLLNKSALIVIKINVNEIINNRSNIKLILPKSKKIKWLNEKIP